ncbi:hypothetical protein ITJ43_10750 [Microbacterium sp. VKM Ac-2870]|uniref:hypothetical protein n=1 Tax=Microbacterium sp. VKM Ac-2870 TaxID=2783825 RepID=UPI001A0189E8|nr:hypothetical protein [Microbacterium sp. VKM Ac-2870]MBF4562620.1 hypothetical protein [Microbacterium sp. VKM Ac-2870]
MIKKSRLMTATVGLACAVGLVLGGAAAANAQTVSGNSGCSSSQTSNVRSAVTASAPSNAPSSHFYSSSGYYYNFTGIATKYSSNAPYGGNTGWQAYSPYSFAFATQACGPNPN